MQKIIIVYNRRSSQNDLIRREIMEPMRKLSGVMVGKYEVEKTNVDENAKTLAEMLNDDDIVLALGGDATATIALNGIMLSGTKARLSVLPYGNFNDLARTLRTESLTDVFNMKKTGQILSSTVEEKKFYPLAIYVNGELFRFAGCYVTIGMMAEAVKIFDEPKVRKKLKSWWGRKVSSYLILIKWYLFNRRKKNFLPDEMKVNGREVMRKSSDYVAINGKSAARVMKGGDDWGNPKMFRSVTERTVKMFPLLIFMLKSIFCRVPGVETTKDILTFATPSEVEIQAEGEYRSFKNVEKIEIRKPVQYVRVISRAK